MRVTIQPPKPARMLPMLTRLHRDTPAIMSRSLNRSLTTGRAQLARETRKELNVLVGKLKEAMKPKRATRARLQAEITIGRGRRDLIPLKYFYKSGGQRTSGSRYPKPIRVKVKRTIKTVKGGFFGPVGRSHSTDVTFARGLGAHIFKRHGAKRRIQGHRGPRWGQPIRKLFGPSIGAVSKQAWPEARKAANAMFLRTVQHEINRVRKKTSSGILVQ